MRFNVAFGKSNVFSLDLAPVTNKEWVDKLISEKREPVDAEWQRAFDDPFGASFTGTLEKARQMCEGGTVVFAH